MKKSNLKLINQSIQMSYDKEGNRYDLPLFVINDPCEYKVQKVDAQFEVKNIEVILFIWFRLILIGFVYYDWIEDHQDTLHRYSDI
jgi:hypothetical protein